MSDKILVRDIQADLKENPSNPISIAEPLEKSELHDVEKETKGKQVHQNLSKKSTITISIPEVDGRVTQTQ